MVLCAEGAKERYGLRERCRQFVCEDCSVVVSKASKFAVAISKPSRAALEATNSRAKGYWKTPASRSFPVICCHPCADGFSARFAQAQAEEEMRRQQRQEKVTAMAPSPTSALPEDCRFAFARGTWRTVDSDGAAGSLRFGVNSAGHVGGFWQIPPHAKPDKGAAEKQEAAAAAAAAAGEQEEEE